MRLWLILAMAFPVWGQAAPGHRVRSLRVTVLSTMLATRGIGEWGFAALVEADGRKILFDTARAPKPWRRTPGRWGSISRESPMSSSAITMRTIPAV
ncbi:MAG TPA: hypothetical protein VL285_25600 [Bryobacteraceae bacterium]|nr:hypothetical protein [Bryobacteraceae bacterium]